MIRIFPIHPQKTPLGIIPKKHKCTKFQQNPTIFIGCRLPQKYLTLKKIINESKLIPFQQNDLEQRKF